MNDRPMNVVIVEDDRRYRESLSTLLTHAEGIRFSGAFPSVEAALEQAQQDAESRSPSWDLVLMDVELPGANGIDGTRALKKIFPETHVVILTVFEEPTTILEAICAGVDGYLLKRSSPAEILRQIRLVAGGASPLTPGVARTVLDLLRGTQGRLRGAAPESSPTRLDLTDREQDVLRCLVRGLSYKQVAAELTISIDTVRTHIRSVYGKLQVHNVADAVSRAIRERLV